MFHRLPLSVQGLCSTTQVCTAILHAVRYFLGLLPQAARNESTGATTEFFAIYKVRIRHLQPLPPYSSGPRGGLLQTRLGVQCLFKALFKFGPLLLLHLSSLWGGAALDSTSSSCSGPALYFSGLSRSMPYDLSLL